ncbi:Gti1/Pac2 family-domain-containing protein [Blastocladiella britannica]|nr:Gti1/Pac2 family-domain-containing protein [Blastocladiella britannica]
MASPQTLGPQTSGPLDLMSASVTWHGSVRSVDDALLVIEAARTNILPRATRRLTDFERATMIEPGATFVLEESESQVRRWADSRNWSSSRMRANFFEYFSLPDRTRIDAASAAQTHALAAARDTPLLKKRSLAIATTTGHKYRLIHYYARDGDPAMLTPERDPALANVVVPEGLYSIGNDTSLSLSRKMPAGAPAAPSSAVSSAAATPPERVRRMDSHATTPDLDHYHRRHAHPSASTSPTLMVAGEDAGGPHQLRLNPRRPKPASDRSPDSPSLGPRLDPAVSAASALVHLSTTAMHASRDHHHVQHHHQHAMSYTPLQSPQTLPYSPYVLPLMGHSPPTLSRSPSEHPVQLARVSSATFTHTLPPHWRTPPTATRPLALPPPPLDTAAAANPSSSGMYPSRTMSAPYPLAHAPLPPISAKYPSPVSTRSVGFPSPGVGPSSARSAGFFGKPFPPPVAATSSPAQPPLSLPQSQPLPLQSWSQSHRIAPLPYVPPPGPAQLSASTRPPLLESSSLAHHQQQPQHYRHQDEDQRQLRALDHYPPHF